MLCPNCGRDNDPNRRTCAFCGTELPSDPVTPPTDPVPKWFRALGAVLRVLLYVFILMGTQSCVASGYVMSRISAGGVGVPSIEDATAYSDKFFNFVAETIADNITALTLVSGLVAILVVCLLQTIRRRNLPDALMAHSFNPFRIPMLALFGAALSLFVSITLSILPLPESLTASLEAEFAPITEADPMLALISVAVVGGIIEEIIFRGIALTRLQKFGNAFAVIVSSVIFGWAHSTVLAGIYAALIGLIFASLALKYHSILPGMVCHIAFNAASLIPIPLSWSVILPLYVISIAVLILGAVRIFVRYPTFTDVALDTAGRIPARDETEARIFARIREIRQTGDATPEELEQLRDDWDENAKNRRGKKQ